MSIGYYIGKKVELSFISNYRQVGRDSRPVMRAAYELFRDGGDTKEVQFLMILQMKCLFYVLKGIEGNRVLSRMLGNVVNLKI